MRYVCSAAAALIAGLMFSPSSQLQGAVANSGISIDGNYTFVSQARSTRTLWYITYRAELLNQGAALPGVTATLTSLAPSVTVVPGQGTIHFAPVPANGTVTSNDTFTILVDTTQSFSFSNLQWSFNSPVANPGPGQTVALGHTVLLDGGGSSNPEGGGRLTFNWSFASRPPGSNTALANPASVTPSFVPDVAGPYVVTLTVSNGATSASANVTISTVASAPVANAGPNQTVPANSNVVLNGGQSYDIDGLPLTYLWQLISIPSSSYATLGSTYSSVSPSFVADVPGTYIVQLVVNNGTVSSTPATVSIATGNTAAVANAGPNQVVSTGTLVQLNGSQSTDVNGNLLSYKWSLIATPSGSAAALSNSSAVNPTFTVDVPGTYIAQLVVNDGAVDSAASTVTISTSAVLPPLANAGAEQWVVHGTTVTLSGSGSDPQNLALTYKWALIATPSGSVATLSGANTAKPSFTADLPGMYVAQLVTNNGYVNSAASTVLIATTNTAPVALAGSPQTVAEGTLVTLNGSASYDADGDPITYLWSLLSVPAGSNALSSLSAPKTASGQFFADAAGLYVAQLIVNDGYTSSVPATVAITANNSKLSLAPNPLNLLLNAAGTLTVTSTQPAPSGGLTVSFSGFDPTVLAIAPSVTIPANATSATVAVTPLAVGTTNLLATAPSYVAGGAAVTVGIPTISISLPTGVGLMHTVTGTITLSAPAPAAGTLVNISSNSSGIALVSPANYNIASGLTTGSFTVTGNGTGTATITASANNYTSGSANILVSQLGAISLAPNVTVGPGQSAALAVTLSAPAPAGGATISLLSQNPAVLTVPSSVTIAQGATTPAVQPQVTGVSLGSATVNATAPGYQGATQTVQVAANLSFSPATLSIGAGGTQNVSLNVSNSSSAPITVALASSNTSAVSVPASVTIPGNATSVPVLITARTNGSATITASTTTPNIAGGSLAVTVVSSGVISLPSSLPVGLGQSISYPITLSAAAPAGGVTVALASSDVTKVTISPSAVVIAAGQTQPATQPVINGVATGSATITASAPGFGSTSSVVQVTAALSLAPQTLAVTAGSSQNLTLTLSGPAPAGGVLVNLTTSFSGVVNVPTPISIAAGATTATIAVTGVAAGSTNLTASAAPSNISNATASITVQPEGVVGLAANVSVGPSQSAPFAVTLPSAAPAGGVTVTLSSTANASITPTTVAIAAGQTQPATQPQVTGVSFGSATISASAPGYASASQTVTIAAKLSLTPTPVTLTGPATQTLTLTLSAPAPSPVTVNLSATPSGIVTIPASVTIAQGSTTASVQVTASSAGATTISAATTTANIASASASVTVQGGGALSLPSGATVALGQSAAFTVTLPAPAPAGGVTVALASSVPANVTISPATVTIAAGATQPATAPQISGLAPGSSTITATAPLYTSASQAVAVTATIALAPQTVALTTGNSQTLTLTLSGPAPAGGLTFAVSSSASTVAAASAASYTIAAGSTTVGIPVSGLTPGTATITASAANLTSASAAITVTQSIGIIVPATLSVGPGNQVTFPVTLGTAPASAVTVTLANSNTNVATLNFSNVSFNAGSTTPTRQPILTAVGSGSATITATAPGLTSAQSQVTVGNTATLTPSSQTLVTNTSGSLTLTLSAPVASATTFTLTSSNSNVASPARGQVQFSAGTQTASFTVTAGATPGAAVITASATGIPNATANVTVVGPLALSTTSLPSGTADSAYSTTVQASGGITPYTFSATGLPTNLSINSSTGAITGTPTPSAVGSSTVTVTVNDSSTPTHASVSGTFTLQINKAVAAAIAATSGTPQSVKIATAFAPFAATVTDAMGNPVSGVTVTFTAPASGVSGTFAGGLITNTATTNASGLATSAVFTANNNIGGYNVIASVSGVTNPANFALTNLTGPPATITATSGTPQSVAEGTAFGAPLVVTVKDAGNNPVSGVVVTFAAPTSGASGTFAGGVNTATTNTSGVATSAVFTANGSLGGYNVTASASGLSINFALTNLTGPPASITATSGSSQTAQASAPFAAPLVATVKDSGNNPVSGVVVTFTAPTSGASGAFAGGVNTATTNSSGIATSAIFTANATAGGPYNVTAGVSGLSTSFALTNLSGPAGSITVTSGTPQSVQVNTAFGAPLVVTVKDVNNNPVSGVVVTFTPQPVNGASGTFAGGINTATSNASGIATSAVFTANTKAGSYTITASASGLTTNQPFVLTNLVGPVSAINATSGTPQTAAAYTSFASTLGATVTDAYGNPISGATVTFTAPGNGASGTFTGGSLAYTATSNTSGIATSTIFTANATKGSYTVTASVSGASTPANFALTNGQNPPATIVATSGTPQSATEQTAFSAPLVVTVKDANGNPVSGVVVTFAAPASGASAAFAGGVNTATTNSSGVATSAALTANPTAGNYTVVASVSGLSANFALTNAVGPAASIIASSGTPQSALVKTAFASLLTATVKDSGGNMIGGASVTFSAPTSGASGTFAGGATTATVTTIAGVATSPVFTANTISGAYTVSATVSTFSTSFALTNNSPGAGNITASSGNNQKVAVTSAFAALSATVQDQYGNPISGATVTFTAPTSGAGGTFTGGATTATAVSNTSGIATTPAFTANTTAGAFSVYASTTGVATQATFSLTNAAGPVASLAIVSGSNQSASYGAAFANPLKVIAKDAYSNIVSGATVTFTAPGTGASGTFAGGANTAVTDSTGTAASAVFTANLTVGTYTVTASAGSVTASFTLTNAPGQAVSLTVTAGSGQSAQVTKAFANALQVTAKDAGGNLVPNATVTFTAPASGASGTFAGGVITATTNASGVATSAIFSANTAAGTYSVTASSGTANVTLSLTNTAGPVASIGITAGNTQAATVNTAYATPLTVVADDAYTNPVSGVNITFTAPSSGASGTFSNGTSTITVATNSGGTAAAPFKANTVAGSVTVSAAASSTITASFNNLTNQPGAAALVSVSTGSGQSAVTGVAFANPLQALVTDAYGNPVRGITVTFTAPNSATTASGTFAGGTNTSTGTTTSSGVATSAVFTANGSTGSYIVAASVSGITATAPFALTNTGGCTGCGAITVTSATIGRDLEAPITITFNPALPAGTNLTISSNSANALIGNATTKGSQTLNISGIAFQVPTATVATTVQALASSGTATISVAATGYATGTATITFGPSGFVIDGGSGPGAPISAYQGSTTTLTVESELLNSAGAPIASQDVAGGVTVTVPVTSSNTSAGTVSSASASLTGGNSAATLSFKAAAAGTGSTNLSAGTPAGFTAASSGATVVATIETVGIVPFTATVGQNLEVGENISLSGPAGSTVTLTVTSNNPSALMFATSATDPGTEAASITLTVAANHSISPPFYVVGLGNSGSAGYTISAPGYGSVNGTVNLAPSGLAIQSPGGFNAQSFTGYSNNGNAILTVYTGYLVGGNFTASEAPAPGVNVTVGLVSSNSSVGAINPSSVTIATGTSAGATAGLTLGNVGQTVVTASATGFGSTAVTATLVSQPNPILLACNDANIGYGLETQCTAYLPNNAPTGGQVVSVSSSSSTLLFSASAATAGTATLNITVPAGNSVATFYAQAASNAGSPTMTVSSPGATPATATEALANSAIIIAPGISGSPSSTGIAQVLAVYLDSTNTPQFNSNIVGPAAVTFGLASNNSAVASVPASASIAAGNSATAVNVTFGTAGSATISLTQPAGFTTPTEYASSSVSVQ